MPRLFLSREEWPLIAMGIVAGVLTSALILYFFFTGIEGGGVDPALVADPEAGRIERVDRAAEADGPGRGIIGSRERRISERVDRMRVVARPMTGPLALTLRDVVWNDPGGARFARAQQATGRLSTAALGRGDVVLDQVVVSRPVIALRQAAPGAPWNFEEVFAELLEGDDTPGPRRTIHVRNLRIVGGTVDVERPGQRFAFHDMQARVPLLVLSQPGVPDPYLRLAGLTTRFVQAEPEARLALDVSDALVSFPTGRVRFDVTAAVLDRTRLADVSGVWNPAEPGYGITAEGRALALELEDFTFMLPEAFPPTGTASFFFAVRPLPGDRTEATLTQLDARSGDSRITGSFTASIGEEHFALLAADLRLDPLQVALVEGFTGDLPYGGAVTGTVSGTGGDITFDLVANLTSPTVAAPFTVGLIGGVLLVPDGVALQRLVVDLRRVPLAALRAIAPALPVEGVVTGRVALTGPPGRAPLDVDVRLEVGVGLVVAEGVVDLTGAVPRYDLSGRLIGVDLQGVLAPDAPPVSLTAAFSVRGTGIEPATLDAAVRLSGDFTGWEAAPGDTLMLVADVRGGALHLQSMALTLATARLQASGTWRFVEPQSGSLAYDVAVSSLRPWGAYIPAIGAADAAGGLYAAGTVSGTLDRPRLTGGFTGTRLVVGDWGAESVVAEHEVEFGGDALPFAVVDASVVDLRTPTAGDFSSARLALRLTPPGLSVELDARRPDGGAVELAGTGMLPETGEREFVLERARIDLAEGQWILERPAFITWVGDDLFVRGLELNDTQSEGRIAIEGQLRPPLGINARIEIAAVPTGDVQRLLGQPVRLEGLLWVDASVRGALDDPLVDVTFRVEEGAIADVPVRQLQGSAIYRDRLTTLEASAVMEPDGRLDFQARLPSILQFEGTPVFDLIDGVPLGGFVQAERFALAPLAVFLPDVRDLTGTVDARVDLGGTAENPVVDGAATLTGGALTVVALDQRYDQITGDVEFDGRRLVIRDLRARSDGWIVAGGAVVLERLDQPVLDLEILLDGFRPIGVDNLRDAAAFGRLAITGPPSALIVTGDVRVDDGYVVIPQLGGAGADLLDITRPAPVIGESVAPAEGGGLMENLQIRDLRVTAGEGAWFMADEARAQLSGTLVVNRVGASMPIVGVLEGTRGQYTLLAGPIVRRFDIVNAQVRFLGAPQPNPALDITARRIVFDPGGRELPVDVRVTGTLENPRIALAGAEAVDIAEAELLSLLLFGQPGFALGGGLQTGEDLLQQTLGGALAEVVAIELERSLAGVGLDIFQIRLGQGALGGLATPTVVMGRQLREDVFLTVETGITALMGGAGTTQSTLGTWAIRLDWAFDPRSRLRLAVEPVFTGRGLRGAPLALPLTDPRQQLLVELRRRWTY